MIPLPQMKRNGSMPEIKNILRVLSQYFPKCPVTSTSIRCQSSRKRHLIEFLREDATTQILLATSHLYLDIRCFPKFRYLLVIYSLDKCYLYKYCLSEERYFPLLDEFISEIIVFCVLDIEINKHFLCIANWCWRLTMCIHFINKRKIY